MISIQIMFTVMINTTTKLAAIGWQFTKNVHISVDLEKHLNAFTLFNRYISILNRVAISIEDILRQYKVSFYTPNTFGTRN